MSHRWPPKSVAKKAAWRARGIYLCAGYETRAHKVPLTVNRKNNVFVDHIEPIIDPATGFVSWDETIARMFCESHKLQVLCKECHDRKTKDEKAIRTQARARPSR